MNLLDELEESWWFELSKEATERMIIDLRYVEG